MGTLAEKFDEIAFQSVNGPVVAIFVAISVK